MEAVHLHLVKEYIIRLSKRRLVLKTPEQQQQLARHILTNANAIQHFCTDNVSTPLTPRAPDSPIGSLPAWPDTALGLSALMGKGHHPSTSHLLAGLHCSLAAACPPHHC